MISNRLIALNNTLDSTCLLIITYSFFSVNNEIVTDICKESSHKHNKCIIKTHLNFYHYIGIMSIILFFFKKSYSSS